ncbi:MAG: GNAT family N-acetyltransferase [Acidobacteria bacterium]|nr:GNAT family N-acetyltransferase [Acidobacteriota bacterium]
MFSNSQLRTEVIDEPAKVAALRSEWHQLFLRCSARTPFQSAEWLLSWMEIFCPANLRVVVVRENGRMIGIAPLLIYPRQAERVLGFAGGGISDYLDVLAEAGKEVAVCQATFAAVSQDPSWTIMELTDIGPHSMLMRLPSLRPFRFAHDRSSVLPLPSDRRELLPIFSPRQRANLRNARSRLERAGGGLIEFARVETLSEFLEDLFRLHTLRWSDKGEPGVLEEERLRTFHKIAAPLLIARGLLRIYRLRVQAGTAAVLYTLFDRDTVYCYLQGFHPEFGFFSPGTLLMFSAIEDAVDRGMRSFDFLRGQEAYKQHWRAQAQSTYQVRAAAADVAWLSSSQLLEEVA